MQITARWAAEIYGPTGGLILYKAVYRPTTTDSLVVASLITAGFTCFLARMMIMGPPLAFA